MKRHAFMLKIWREHAALIPEGSPVAIAGGGIAGLTLALALAQRGLRVTLFEPRRCGAVRVPLFHACRQGATTTVLWQKAAAFGRQWYGALERGGCGVEGRDDGKERYFTIHGRPLLRFLQNQLAMHGGKILRQPFAWQKQRHDSYRCIVNATGAAMQAQLAQNIQHATQSIHGWKSYYAFFSGHSQLSEEDESNLILFHRRAGFIHRNSLLRQDAVAKARAIEPSARHALFEGDRLVTRDRLPIVGFSPSASTRTYDRFRFENLKSNFAASALNDGQPFLFGGFGYHAFTYAPYLANAVAEALCAGKLHDENMICLLSPIRFLPRGTHD